MKDQINTTKNEKESIVIYSPAKVAEILEVKETFVKRLLRDGKLKGFKLGKFWRISKASLDEYCQTCSGNGTGKTGVRQNTKKKFQFHAALRSQNRIPDSMEMIEKEIRDAKEQIRSEVGYKKVASIARLKTAVMLRHAKQQKLETMDEYLGKLASEAYPEVNGLIDEQNPDALEQMFEELAKNQNQKMVDLIDRETMKSIGDRKENPPQDDGEVNMVKVAEAQ